MDTNEFRESLGWINRAYREGYDDGYADGWTEHGEDASGFRWLPLMFVYAVATLVLIGIGLLMWRYA